MVATRGASQAEPPAPHQPAQRSEAAEKGSSEIASCGLHGFFSSLFRQGGAGGFACRVLAYPSYAIAAGASAFYGSSCSGSDS